MAQYVPINMGTDVIVDTTKVTTGYFTGGVGTLAGSNLTTASLSTTQKSYYYNLQYSSEDQLSITYGHYAGSGSSAKNETKAIYKQFANLLLDPSDLASTGSNGFIFTGTHPSSGSVSMSLAAAAEVPFIVGTVGNDAGTGNAGESFEDAMYFIVAERARMKDRLNKENWTLTLSGSRGINGGEDITEGGSGSSKTVVLTDDSKTVAPTATPVGPRYNVVSGSDGTIVSASMYYGYFYPNIGVIALRQNILSASLPGTAASVTSSWIGTTADIGQGGGLAQNTAVDADNAMKLVNSIHMGTFTLRSEEDQTSKAYFCRALANDFNFTNNPTFVSGSDKAFLNQDMIGYPHTFITTVGLYHQSAGGSMELVAVGKLSSPVQKNFGTEATIKVKLTY